MRVTLVTETYFPQVNGVSRTLGELARFLTESGDRVQLIHPDYGAAAIASRFTRSARSSSHSTRSFISPGRRSDRSIGRSIRFGPRSSTSPPRRHWVAASSGSPCGADLPVVSSFHTNFDQYSRHYRVGWASGLIGRYLRWFHNRTRETYVPSETTIRELEHLGFERMVLWKRGVDSSLFRPDRAGRLEVRRALGWSAEDVVITYVSRIATEKNVDYLADALAIVASRRPDVRILLVGDGPSRPGPGAADRVVRAVRGLSAGGGPGRPLCGFGHLRLYQSDRDLRQRGPRGDGIGSSRGGPAGGGVGETVQSGSTGDLVEPSEPPARFASALLGLIEQPDERRRMARAARTYAVSQNWDAIMATLRDRYQSVIDAEAGRLTAGRADR